MALSPFHLFHRYPIYFETNRRLNVESHHRFQDVAMTRGRSLEQIEAELGADEEAASGARSAA
jgi:hypothetical protein